MSVPKSWPHRIRVGSVEVPIYRNATGPSGEYVAFVVVDHSSGKRRRRKFSSFEDARSEAQRIAVALSNGDAAAASVDYRDAASLVRCRELLQGVGVTLEAAVEMFVEAARLVGPHRVVEAAKDHARRFPTPVAKVRLDEACDEYHRVLEERGRGSRHLADVKTRLGRFISDHPGATLDQITTQSLQRWVDGLKGMDGKPLSALTRRNSVVVVGGMLDYHRRRGRIADNPARDIERPEIRKAGDVEFWRHDEARALLECVSPVARAGLAVALFAGCRSAEIARLTRSDFDFAGGYLAIGRDKAKTASRRLVPIAPNLRAWLAEFEACPPEAPLWAGGAPDGFVKAVTEACGKAGVRRVENGARHAYITHRVAQTGDVARTALEAGNSAGVVHSHYRGLCRPEDATAYFDVRP